jgi:hypothetical protein
MRNIIIAFILALPVYVLAQDGQQYNKKIELGFALDPVQGGSGVVWKAEQRRLNNRHIEGYLGFSGQVHRNQERKFSTAHKGGTTDLGLYVVTDWVYYPFASKHLFAGAEGFAGITNYKSAGTLSIPEYGVKESFSHSYTYFNYGVGLNLGYDFGRITATAFGKASLKGLLDKGRLRPFDTDSRGFVGVSVGVKF